MDREYRGDEQADIFKDRATVDAYIAKVSNDRGTEFESDIKNLRLKMYLLSYLGRKHPSDADQGLWSSRARAKFLDPVYGNAIQNLFRLSRYVNPELVTLDLNATFLK